MMCDSEPDQATSRELTETDPVPPIPGPTAIGDASTESPPTVAPAVTIPGVDVATEPSADPLSQRQSGAGVAHDPELGVEHSAAEELAGENSDLTGPTAGIETDIASTISDRLDVLQGELAELARLEERHTSIIERLHAENTALRQGELTQALKPLVLDIARLHDDIASVIAKGGDELRMAAAIPLMILDVLERHGVTQISPEVGQPFDGKVHQALRIVSSDDAGMDGMIASVQRRGFIRDGNHLVRAAQVEVYRHVPPTASTTQDNEHSGSDGIG